VKSARCDLYMDTVERNDRQSAAPDQVLTAVIVKQLDDIDLRLDTTSPIALHHRRHETVLARRSSPYDIIEQHLVDQDASLNSDINHIQSDVDTCQRHRRRHPLWQRNRPRDSSSDVNGWRNACRDDAEDGTRNRKRSGNKEVDLSTSVMGRYCRQKPSDEPSNGDESHENDDHVKRSRDWSQPEVRLLNPSPVDRALNGDEIWNAERFSSAETRCNGGDCDEVEWDGDDVDDDGCCSGQFSIDDDSVAGSDNLKYYNSWHTDGNEVSIFSLNNV